ncbi:hypothetical protein Prudu_022840 [Prunus dulcis]|uniref:Uncharacterized protein n=1 Tax=Prunus dulcis TaxID=3755 RepID=A0A4Y1S292_PRUDU|nr:hypothetical protein Prudu_022840 [Prunus dulcis]
MRLQLGRGSTFLGIRTGDRGMYFTTEINPSLEEQLCFFIHLFHFMVHHNLNNLCNWTVIVCDHNTKAVVEIDLSNLGVSANLTQFKFTQFLNLTHFNLNGNSFKGSIPSAIGNLQAHNIGLGQQLFHPRNTRGDKRVNGA